MVTLHVFGFRQSCILVNIHLRRFMLTSTKWHVLSADSFFFFFFYKRPEIWCAPCTYVAPILCHGVSKMHSVPVLKPGIPRHPFHCSIDWPSMAIWTGHIWIFGLTGHKSCYFQCWVHCHTEYLNLLQIIHWQGTWLIQITFILDCHLRSTLEEKDILSF